MKTNRSTTLLKNAKEIEFYKKWHNDILISTDAINSVASVKGAGKSSLAPVTSYSDAVTISAGQDNVGKIILTVLSFMRLKVDHERDYKGGLIFIDEIETSLYPAAQIQLLKFMFKVASDLSLQFFFTTHSETIIKFLKLSKYAPKARIAFLKKMGTTIVASSEQSLPQIENNLVLRSFPERDNLPDKIRVYAEDDKTFSNLPQYFKYRNWIAHGRYWIFDEENYIRRYNFDSICLLVGQIHKHFKDKLKHSNRMGERE